MNNKAHLRPKDFDSNGDIIPMACKEEKGDLISREALRKLTIWTKVSNGAELIDIEVVPLDTIDNAPTVEPTENSAIQYSLGYQDGFLEGKKMNERPQGEWIGINRDCRGYCDCFKCSICGAYIYPNSVEKELDYNGCPYCFADMRGAE